jgi:hypothetical protein
MEKIPQFPQRIQRMCHRTLIEYRDSPQYLIEYREYTALLSQSTENIQKSWKRENIPQYSNENVKNIPQFSKEN